MNSTLIMNREQYLKGLGRQMFFQRLSGAYQVVLMNVYLAASWDTTLKRPNFDDIHRTLDTWVDEELSRFGALPDLTEQKRKIVEAFADLEKKHQNALDLTDRTNQRCLICGGQLQDLPHDLAANTCLNCARPLIAALDDLVVASTDLITPEKIRKNWFSALNDFDEIGPGT